MKFREAVVSSCTTIIAVCALSFAGPFTASAHDIHISYTRGEARPDGLHLRVTYYKDDFILAITKWFGHAPATGQEWTDAKQGYLKSVWSATAVGAEQPIAITNGGEDPQSMWFEFDVRIPPQTHTITLTHRGLFAQFGNQGNVLTVQTPAGEQTYMMTAGSPTCEVRL